MSHPHLTLEERVRIELFVSMGMNCREIARHLGRSHSTVSRELRRNVGSAKKGYRAQSAERRAHKRRKRPRQYRCMNRPGSIAWVDEKLRANWSPEQIAGRIRLEYPEDQKMRISTETLYRWVYAAAQFGDTRYRHLRRAHKRRRRQTRYGQRLFSGRIDISYRPGIVAGKTRFGDWEADLVCASKGKAALLSCNERKSRFLLLARAQDKTAASFNAALIPCLRAVPSKLRQTSTLDNGSEMAGFRALESATGLRTYFCWPHAPWQRGTNENEGGLLRQYFPRGSGFHKITEKMVLDAAEQLNNRPRKCVHYQTPAEVFNSPLKKG